MTHVDVFIIGSGISGLVLGYELCKQDYNVVIVEKAGQVGGLAKTVYEKDIYFDSGPHLFHTKHPEILEYWRDLVGSSLVEKDFFAGNVIGNKIFNYPIDKKALKDQFSDQEADLVLDQLKQSSAEKLAQCKSYEDYVNVLCGPILASKFFISYPHKLWGIHPSDLSARFAPRRLEIREERLPFHHGKGKFAGVIEGGCGILAEVLAERIEALGGEFRFNKNVRKLGVSDGDTKQKIDSIEFEDGEILNTTSSLVVSTASLDINAGFIGKTSNLYFRSCYAINLVVQGNDPFPADYDWLYFSGDDVPFHRAGLQTRFSRKGIPDDLHIICCEIAYTNKPGTQEIKKWRDQTIGFFRQSSIFKNSNIIDVYEMDIGPVYPGYFIGYEAEVSRVNSELDKFNNFYQLGSLAEYAYSDLQVLTAKAIDLASEISSELSSDRKQSMKTSGAVLPSKQFMFGKHEISALPESRSFLIAEIGLSHNGNVELCKNLILEAKEAGFDAAKIQTYSTDRISKKTRSARYFEETLDQEEPLSNYLDKIIFDELEISEIFSYAKDIGLEMFSTPFDIISAEQLMSHGVNGFKISSMDLINLPLIEHVAGFGLPVIISTGMGDLGEIENAIKVCLNVGNPNIAVLHCVSSYPCPMYKANLSRIRTISDAFGVITGFSDHTTEIMTPALSIPFGAKIIEKHITLDKKMDGPDHNFSLVPVEMKAMVQLVRSAEGACYNHQMYESSAELSARRNLRRSVYSAANLSAGHILTPEDIVIKSPGDGLQVEHLNIILGKRLVRDLEEDMPINWDNFLLTRHS